MAKTEKNISTKDKLLLAAVRVFGTHGFDGASTRMITKEAGVNISAIPYYFDGKEGLYEATLQHMADVIAKNVAFMAGKIEEELDENPSKERCREIFLKSIESFIHFLCGDSVSPYVAQIFIREQLSPTPNFNILYDSLIGNKLGLLTKLFCIATGVEYPSEEAKIATHSILGQAVIFKTHKEAALRRLEWKSFGPEEIEKISRVVIKQTEAIFDMYEKEK